MFQQSALADTQRLAVAPHKLCGSLPLQSENLAVLSNLRIKPGEIVPTICETQEVRSPQKSPWATGSPCYNYVHFPLITLGCVQNIQSMA